MANLSRKQELFCLEYIIDANATQAAIRAGYSPKSARQIGEANMSKHDIAERIKKLMAEKEDALIATSNEVLKTLSRVMRRQEKETIVVTVKNRKAYFDENGKKVIDESEEAQLVEIPTRVSDANKAAELLGKRHALFTDKQLLAADIEITPIVIVPDDD